MQQGKGQPAAGTVAAKDDLISAIALLKKVLIGRQRIV